MMKNSSMMFKLSFFILSFTLIIFAGILSFNYYTSKRMILKNVEENAALLTAATVNRIDSIFKANAKIPENLVFALENSDLSETEIKELLVSVVKNNSDVFGSCIGFEPFSFSKDKEYYAPYASRGEKGINFENIGNEKYQYFYLDWYQIPKELGRSAWTEPYFDEGGGNVIMTTYSVPFYRQVDGVRKFRGIVTIDISINWLDEIFTSIKACKTGFGFLISKNGNFVTFPDKNRIMNESIFSIADERQDLNLRKIGRKMIQGKSGIAKVRGETIGKKGFLYYTPVTSCGWSVGVFFPEDELFAGIRELNIKLILFAVTGIILLFSIIILITSRITRPVAKLVEVTEKIGHGNFSAELPPVISNDEIGRLTTSFSKMQKELAEYIKNLQATTAAKEKIESELNVAREIQMSIIPKLFPPFPHRSEFDLYAVIHTAKAVGGDLYDFFLMSDTRLCFVIGDVSGKGVPASLFMAVSRTLLRAKADASKSARELADEINIALATDNSSFMFVTFVLCIVDVITNELEYCNAGHNPPFIIRDNEKLEMFESAHGPPFGVSDTVKYSSCKMILRPDDTIVLYTDGVTEAENADHALFEEERLKQVLEKCKGMEPRGICERIVEEVRSFASGVEQSDDITALVFKYRGGARKP